MTKTQLGNKAVSNGVAQIEYTVPDGQQGLYTLYATYEENDHYETCVNSTSYRIRIPTVITVENTRASYGEEAVFVAHVKHHTNQNVDAGTVQFQVGGTNIGTPVNVVNGVATLTFDEAPNSWDDNADITASFIQTDLYGGSVTSTPATLFMRDDTTVLVSNISGNRDSNVTIEATITSGAGADLVNVNEGTAKLYIDNTVQGNEVNVVNGQVSFTYHIADNAVTGGHTIKVEYVPATTDAEYDPSESTAVLTVRIPTVLTAVNVIGNKGATVPVTINAKDQNNTSLTSGTVSITIGSESPQTAIIGANGEATINYTIPQTAEGGDVISFTASYVEDVNYQGSTMATSGTISVRYGTGIVVDSVQAELGDTITLSSTVTDENEDLVNEGSVVYEIE